MRINIDNKLSGQQLPTAAIASVFCEIGDLLRPMLKKFDTLIEKMDVLIASVEKGVTEAQAGKDKADEVISHIREDIEERKAAKVKP